MLRFEQMLQIFCFISSYQSSTGSNLPGTSRTGRLGFPILDEGMNKLMNGYILLKGQDRAINQTLHHRICTEEMGA